MQCVLFRSKPYFLSNPHQIEPSFSHICIHALRHYKQLCILRCIVVSVQLCSSSYCCTSGYNICSNKIRCEGICICHKTCYAFYLPALMSEYVNTNLNRSWNYLFYPFYQLFDINWFSYDNGFIFIS